MRLTTLNRVPLWLLILLAPRAGHPEGSAETFHFLRTVTQPAVVAATQTGPAKRATELRAQARSASGQKRYGKCSRLFEEATRLDHDQNDSDAYGGACCHALACEKVAAFAALEHAYLKTINPELFHIFEEDQGDRAGGDPSKIKWAEVGPRDAKRRERVRQILEAGGAKAAADYFHAAMVFQHGHEVSDYQLCHKLALKAAELGPANKQVLWLAAASKDRELMNLGKPQLYGTQFRTENGKWVLYQVDSLVTDEERAKWNVPPLEQARKRAEAMNQRKIGNLATAPQAPTATNTK